MTLWWEDTGILRIWVPVGCDGAVEIRHQGTNLAIYGLYSAERCLHLCKNKR